MGRDPSAVAALGSIGAAQGRGSSSTDRSVPVLPPPVGLRDSTLRGQVRFGEAAAVDAFFDQLGRVTLGLPAPDRGVAEEEAARGPFLVIPMAGDPGRLKGGGGSVDGTPLAAALASRAMRALSCATPRVTSCSAEARSAKRCESSSSSSESASPPSSDSSPRLEAMDATGGVTMPGAPPEARSGGWAAGAAATTGGAGAAALAVAAAVWSFCMVRSAKTFSHLANSSANAADSDWASVTRRLHSWKALVSSPKACESYKSSMP